MSNGTLAPPEFDQSEVGSPVPPGRTNERRGLSSRLSVGHVLTAVAGLLTFFLLLLVLAERNEPEVTVVVASEPIEEGVPLTADLFEEVTLPEGNPLADGAVTAMDQLDGSKTAQRDFPAESVLTETDLTDIAAEAPGSGLRSLSIPIEADQAVGGQILNSDLVDIVAVGSDRAWIPAAGLEVLDAGGEAASSIIGDGGSDTGYLTLAVSADEAVAISFASANAKEIFVVRSTGATKLPVLADALGADDVGVGSPSGGSAFAPANIDESVNEALGGVLDDLLQEESTE